MPCGWSRSALDCGTGGVEFALGATGARLVAFETLVLPGSSPHPSQTEPTLKCCSWHEKPKTYQRRKHTNRFDVDHRAVGYDGLVFLHQIYFALVVVGGICGVGQAVNGTALRAGADGHTGDGLVTAHTVHRASAANAVLHLLRHIKTP